MSEIARQGVSAVKWSAISTIARFGLQLLAQVVLARMLGPDVYGVFGIGLVVYAFSTFVAEFGFTMNLVQRKTLTDEDIRQIFTWQLVTGVLAFIALYLLAPALSNYFNEPRVEPVIRWLSLACILNATTATPWTLLARDMRFRTQGLIDVASYVVGYILIGIPMAAAGMGVDALVAAWLSQSLFKTLVANWIRRFPMRPLLWAPNGRELVEVGGTVFVTNWINWALNNIDRIVVGRYLVARSVGLYTTSFNLANTPNSLLLGSLQSAFLSAGARTQDDVRKVAHAYRQVLATVWVVIAPLFAGLSVASRDIIGLLYGDAWMDAAGVLAVLMLAMPFFICWGLSTPVLWNTGRKHQESLLQLPILAAAPVVLYLAVGHGIGAVAAVALGLYVARCVVIVAAACRALSMKWLDALASVGRGVVLCLVVAAGASAGSWAIGRLTEAHFVRLIAEAIGGGGFALAFVALAPRLSLGPDAIAMVLRFVPRLAPYLNRPGVPAAPDLPRGQL